MPTRPVAVIIGMMGAGKTRVGKEVAQLMSMPFADADVEIEHEVGMRIPEYFERHGEPAFREVESEVIAGMLHGFGGVFALGGGAPMTPAVQDDLKGEGFCYACFTGEYPVEPETAKVAAPGLAPFLAPSEPQNA